MALVVAAGFVVDDAIVVIENIARHIEAGQPPLQAALNGSREIGFTIISLTFSLIAVLIRCCSWATSSQAVPASSR